MNMISMYPMQRLTGFGSGLPLVLHPVFPFITTLLCWGQLHCLSSGGWQQWMTVTSAPIVLGPGQKTIRIHSHSSGWNFNWLQLVPAGDHAVASVVVQPDSARIFPGGAVQLTAIGYDADSNFIMLSPAASWHTSGTGAQCPTAKVCSLPTQQACSPLQPAQIFKRAGPGECSEHTRSIADQHCTGYADGARRRSHNSLLANGYDQYGTQVPLTDTIIWTATGTQNSISPDRSFYRRKYPRQFSHWRQLRWSNGHAAW